MPGDLQGRSVIQMRHSPLSSNSSRLAMPIFWQKPTARFRSDAVRQAAVLRRFRDGDNSRPAVHRGSSRDLRPWAAGAAAGYISDEEVIVMSFTGVDNLDASIDKANTWLVGIADGFGTSDRHLAYRVLRAWLHCLRDRLSVEVAAHFAAQLPELLRGVFFDGWNPARVPQKYDRTEYVARFAREARVRESDVPKAARIVSAVAGRHTSAGVMAEAFGLLPVGLRELLEPATVGSAAGWRH